MIYFKTSEIIFSVYASAILGIVFGLIYSSSLETLSYLKKFLALPYQSAKNAVNFSPKRIFIISFEKNNTKIGKIGKNVYEFLIFTVFGCLTILLSYIALDGVFRLYVLLIIGLFLIISKRTLGNLSEKFLRKIYSCSYFILLFLTSFTLIPATHVWAFIANKFKQLKILVLKRMSVINSNRLIQKKRKEIKKY